MAADYKNMKNKITEINASLLCDFSKNVATIK